MRQGRRYGGLKSDELFDEMNREGRPFLIRIAQNRKTVDKQKTLDEIKKKECAGTVKVVIPRNSQKKTKAREAELQVRYASFEVKRPEHLNKNKNLQPSQKINVIYIKEEQKDKSIEPIEWFLMTNEKVDSFESAYEKACWYMQRWKIEQFHYVLKSGCKVEKRQERSMDKTTTLILMYSIIATFIMNITYMARINPDLPCSDFFEEEEWRVLYCAANKTKEAPEVPYTIKEAITYLSWLGGPKRAPSDGPPGLKVIWIGLNKLYTLLACRQLLWFSGSG
jgi:hypothetical protein